MSTLYVNLYFCLGKFSVVLYDFIMKFTKKSVLKCVLIFVHTESSNTDSPSSPENLHVVSTKKGSIFLEWQPAKETSITPVEGYVIEMSKGYSKDFTEVARIDGGTCKFDATGLKDGEKYNFRVKSVNPAGTSVGSAQLDKPVIASEVGKRLYCYAMRYCNAMRDLRVFRTLNKCTVI